MIKLPPFSASVPTIGVFQSIVNASHQHTVGSITVPTSQTKHKLYSQFSRFQIKNLYNRHVTGDLILKRDNAEVGRFPIAARSDDNVNHDYGSPTFEAWDYRTKTKLFINQVAHRTENGEFVEPITDAINPATKERIRVNRKNDRIENSLFFFVSAFFEEFDLAPFHIEGVFDQIEIVVYALTSDGWARETGHGGPFSPFDGNPISQPDPGFFLFVCIISQ